MGDSEARLERFKGAAPPHRPAPGAGSAEVALAAPPGTAGSGLGREARRPPCFGLALAVGGRGRGDRLRPGLAKVGAARNAVAVPTRAGSGCSLSPRGTHCPRPAAPLGEAAPGPVLLGTGQWDVEGCRFFLAGLR